MHLVNTPLVQPVTFSTLSLSWGGEETRAILKNWIILKMLDQRPDGASLLQWKLELTPWAAHISVRNARFDILPHWTKILMFTDHY